MSRHIEHVVVEQPALPDEPDGTTGGSHAARGGVSNDSTEAARNEVTVDLQMPSCRCDVAAGDDAIEIAPGHVFRDRYVILETLGSGGRGTVFKALDLYRTSLLDSQRHVALKVLHPGGAGGHRTLKDLAHELDRGQALSHRNIVKVFELDRDGEVVFFTMEFLEGELLSSLIRRMSPRGMEPSHAAQLIRQLGAGVQHAHERGIVHGDLKPRNIWVTRSGELRILDFGAARKAGSQDTPASPDKAAGPDANLRQPVPGSVSGTPAYASCELLEGRAADPSDDLYAVACISYELLTSVHPFAHRPAIVARNYGVRAKRPEGISSRQWNTLQKGLSWHRAGRSTSVGAWTQKLTRGVPRNPRMTPLLELKAVSIEQPIMHPRAAAAFLAAVLIAGGAMGHLREATQSTHDQAGSVAPGAVRAETPLPASTAAVVSPDPTVLGAPVVEMNNAQHGMASSKLPANSPPMVVSIGGYHVVSGNRFVEIRVHRNQSLKSASFVWWTEPATARPDVEFVHQSKAIQTFPAGRRSTRCYVKLLPDGARTQRDYFYVAISQPGIDPSSSKVTRTQIWLPISREGLQARR